MKPAGRLTAASLALAALAFGAADQPPPRTVVTLGFDDARETQLVALPLLAAHGMRASFFINSGNVGTRGYLDYARLAEIQAAGHELGGHTVDHEVLTTLSPAETTHQACDDRQALAAAGLGPLTSFAYPGGATDPERSAIVASCGYRYGWAQGGLDGADCTADCVFAEPAEPPDPMRLRSPRSVEQDWTLEDLQGFVLRAERTGGWIGLSFHHVCDDCGYRYRISPALLEQFLSWLAPRAASGTVVLPLAEAFAGASPEGPPPTPDPATATPAVARAPSPLEPTPTEPGRPVADGCSTGASSSPGWLPAALLALLLRRVRSAGR